VGPFEVLEPPSHATNPNGLWLKTPRQFKIHMPVNVKDIKRYHRRDDDLGSCSGPPEEMPEPIVIDGEDCYQVEAVLAERTQKKTRKRAIGKCWSSGQGWICCQQRGSQWETFPSGRLTSLEDCRRMTATTRIPTSTEADGVGANSDVHRGQRCCARLRANQPLVRRISLR
jgi:hypothetical protein